LLLAVELIVDVLASDGGGARFWFNDRCDVGALQGPLPTVD